MSAEYLGQLLHDVDHLRRNLDRLQQEISNIRLHPARHRAAFIRAAIQIEETLAILNETDKTLALLRRAIQQDEQQFSRN